MKGSDDEIEIPLEKLSQFVGLIFLQGMDVIGGTDRKENEAWFNRQAWDAVCACINNMDDGEYETKALRDRLRLEYIVAAGLPQDLEVLPGEEIVWEAIGRALFAVIMNGEMDAENTPESWANWMIAKLEQEGFKRADLATASA